jgi:hypothetical protein
LTDERLYDAITDALFALKGAFRRQQLRLAYYQQSTLPTSEVLQLIFRGYKEDFFPKTSIADIEELWADSPFSIMDVNGDTVWKLLCAILLDRQGTGLPFQPEQHPELTTILDEAAGYHAELTERVLTSTRA